MKKKWGVLRTAVLLKSKIGPKVLTEDDNCPQNSKSLVYPYPTKFAKPHGYPTKFDKPEPYPTEFLQPNQIQMQTQTNEATFLSKWENAIHQLIVQANKSKGPAVCVSAPETENVSESELAVKAKPEATATEPAVSARLRWGKVAHQLVSENNRRKRSVAPASGPQSVSYSPSLPAPEGPFPPPAFTYNSPAHGPKITSGPEAEKGSTPENAPTPAYSLWNSVFRQLTNQSNRGEGVDVSEAATPTEVGSTPVSNIYPPLPSLPPSSPPVIICTSPEHGIKTTTEVETLHTSKVKTA